MNIKLRTDNIFRIYENVEKTKRTEEDLLDDIDISKGFSYRVTELYLSDIEFFDTLLSMAKAVNGTSYPYVLINEEEFNKLKKYI